MPSPIEKKASAFDQIYVGLCGSAFYPCFDQAFSFLLFQRFLCMCCGFVPEFCGEATPGKKGSFCIFCWICVSDRKGMSNRLGEHSLTVMLSRITTWTRLVAMDNSWATNLSLSVYLHTNWSIWKDFCWSLYQHVGVILQTSNVCKKKISLLRQAKWTVDS